MSAVWPVAIAIYAGFKWAARPVVQFFVFEPKAFLWTALSKPSYNGLTVVFVFRAVVHGMAAVR